MAKKDYIVECATRHPNIKAEVEQRSHMEFLIFSKKSYVVDYYILAIKGATQTDFCEYTHTNGKQPITSCKIKDMDNDLNHF